MLFWINTCILAKFKSSSGIKINNATTSVIIEIDKLNELEKKNIFYCYRNFSSNRLFFCDYPFV